MPALLFDGDLLVRRLDDGASSAHAPYSVESRSSEPSLSPSCGLAGYVGLAKSSDARPSESEP